MAPSWWISFAASPPGRRRKEVRKIVEDNGGELEGFWAKPDNSRYYGLVSNLDLTDALRKELRVEEDREVDRGPVRKVRREDEAD